SSLQERSAAGVTSPVPRQQDYTWTQDAVGNPYVASVVTTLDGGSPDARQSKAAQTLDIHGNLTQVQQFDYGNLTTPARIYNSTYLTDPNYTSRYIHNRLVSTTVSLGDGSGVVSLVSNKYDGQNDGTCSSVGLVEAKDLAPPPFSQHDASYNAYFIYRGNVKQSKQFGLPWICQYYDVTGVVVSATDRVRSITITPTANNAVPGIITPGGNSNLATTAGYDIALHLTSLLVPNGAQGTSEYASSGLLSKTKSYHGAETNYRYTFNPNTVTATTNTHWTRKTLDGFGREVQTEAGYLNGSAEVTTSIQTTTYGPCACSPLGKPVSVSQPYAPGATNIYYTVTHYDALGRTTSTVSPDGASTTTYSYAGNTTTVTDPAGHWKMFTRDAMGNLTAVTEPNPAGGANWTTSYTYDAPNRLTLVSMPRGSSTQTRTFTYEDTRIRTATNPESGTVTYTYNSDTTLATKVDANGNHLHYWYDTMGRLSKITVGDSQAAEYAFSYDSPSQNAYGRLAAVSFGGYSWIYSYTPGGLVSSK
ncbi:MAG TPA: hypothetical protein VHI52_22945, partial [Verrucomicrobiae bacterium]|nr:hypothetical protein [Verrucomicrobiae bacterium]